MNPQDFHDAVMAKFELKAKEKNRSLQPWHDHNMHFLVGRLREEWMELRDEIDLFPLKMTREWQNELIDVAAFCMFQWMKIEGELNEQNSS